MIALIDGDILVYRVGFAADDVEWEFCKARLQSTFSDILLNSNEATEHKGWLTEGSNNYRHKYAKERPYKGNRPNRKPTHYDAIRNYLVNELDFQVETEQEADDAIGIEAMQRIDECVIVTIDKDLDNIPGIHYNFVKHKEYYVTEDEANRNFYRQLLVGDRVDNVGGLHGIGPVKAERILGDARSSRELYERVLDAYEGDAGRVEENGILLWIRRKPEELWKPPE